MLRPLPEWQDGETGDLPPRRLDIQTRQREILTLVHRRGYASIEALSAQFAVSTQTIRRDIKQLSDLELLIRYHGGAGLPAGADRLAYSNRRVRDVAAKRAIAVSLTQEIPNGASLFIDIGTTMEAVAEALVDHKDLRIVTNHIGVVAILSQGTDFEINLAGGRVRNLDQAVMGESATEFVRRFKVDFGIFSVGAIDAEGLLLDYDYRDIHLSLAALGSARCRYVAADSSKFSGDAMVKLGHVSEIDALFTDKTPPQAIAKALRAHGVQVHVAGRAGSGAGHRRAGAGGPHHERTG